MFNLLIFPIQYRKHHLSYLGQKTMKNRVAVNLFAHRRKQQRRNRKRHKLRLNMKLKQKNQHDSVLKINELLFTEIIQKNKNNKKRRKMANESHKLK